VYVSEGCAKAGEDVVCDLEPRMPEFVIAQIEINQFIENDDQILNRTPRDELDSSAATL
jgi:hypothetical protein